MKAVLISLMFDQVIVILSYVAVVFFNSYINTFTIDTNKIKKAKTKIHITAVRFKATITPEIKVKEEQLQN